MTAQIFQLPPHDNMTPEEAIVFASKLPWEHIIIVGIDKDGALQEVNSSMLRETAVFIHEIAKIRILQQD